MYNKKASGTATSFLISIIIGITMIIAIGSLVNDASSEYSRDDNLYFDGFGSAQGNISVIGEDFQTAYDEDKDDEDKGFFKSIAERFEDNMFYKAFKVVQTIPASLNSLRLGLTKIQQDLGIPTQFVVLLITILSITIIALVIKIIRGYDKV